MAARKGSSDLVSQLLKKGAYIDACFFEAGYSNWTPLCEAILNKNREVVQLLVGKNADIHRRFKHKMFGQRSLTTISLCAYVGDLELVNYFKSKGVNVGKSLCVYWASCGGKESIVKTLIEAPFSLTFDERCSEDKNRTPLHAAVENLNENVVAVIVKSFPDSVKLEDKEKNTALHFASCNRID